MSTFTQATRPVDITQVGSESVDIRWADGHHSSFPLRDLRRRCVCASCRAKREEADDSHQRNPFRVLGPEPSAVPQKLEQVGNYALGITWTDNHHSIYAFDVLRNRCPCEECRTARERREP